MAYEQNQSHSSDESENSQEFDLSALIGGKKKNPHILEKYADSLNIAEELEDHQCQEIVNLVISGIDEDKMTQRDWLSKVDDAQRLAKLVKEPKNTPLPNSANIKFPLITDACCQFAARTYPELIQDDKVVKMAIMGIDPSGMMHQLAEVGSVHMNYQLLGPDSEWEIGVDKLLNVLPNIGFVLKKTYFDTLKKQIISEVCNYKDIILRNAPEITCLNDLRRITHVIHSHPNDLVENCRSGIYCEESVEAILNIYSTKLLNPSCDLYEQHTYLDLDDDGYEEPYIVTIHKDTMKLLRIVARYSSHDIKFKKNKVVRIEPIQYFTDFHFLPSPDGSFMSIGFGTLMLHLNETVNTILNQLIDAGSLANMQTGIIDSRLKIMGGQMTCDPGQWNRVKGLAGEPLKNGIVPIAYKEPSTVLYQLLSLLIQTAKELTSTTDIMQGIASGTNVPATTQLSMIEQGMKRFSAIQKRVWRSMKDEYQKIFNLNKIYTDPQEFVEITGNPQITVDMVYHNPSIRVFPVANPNISSDAQRLAQAQVLMGLLGKPGINNAECYKRYLEAAKIPNPERIAPPQMAQQAQAPDPKVIAMQADVANKKAETQIKARHQDLKEKEFAAKLAKMEAEITQMQANAVKLVAQAKSTQHGDKMQEHSAALNTIKTQLDTMTKAHQQLVDSDIQQKEFALDQQKVQQQHQQAMTGLAVQHSDNVASQQLAQSAQEQQAPNDQETSSDGMDEQSSNSSSNEGS